MADDPNDGHFLAPLLTPRSIAFVGASRREDSPGRRVIEECMRGRYPGAIYPVNPRYEEVEGHRCYPSLAELPEVPDLAVLVLGNPRLEAGLRDAIEAGARAAVIFDSGYLADDTDPPLIDRLRALAREAAIPVCGANCTGFINLDGHTRVAYAPGEHDLETGSVTFISHSGSTFGGFIRNERRLRFNLSVAPGKEVGATVADYMDFALGLESTRVIGLMIETVRDPTGFVAALEKARDRQVPVVALKVGRSALGARLAQSHSGAIAGNDAAYQAVFERHGVVRAGDIDELLATLLLFAEPARPGPGRLSVISDSGGERELFVDMAEEMGVPFAQISESTVARLDAVLAPDLARVNPLDAWGDPHDYEATFGECFDALVADPDAAMGLVISDVLTGFGASETWGRMAARALGRHGKPIAIAALYAATNHGDFGERLTKAGVPVIYGAAAALKAVRNMLAYRDAPPQPGTGPRAPDAAVAAWRDRLATGAPLDESESLALLSDFGIPAQSARIAESLEEAVAAALEFGYPVALKTARPGLTHKSEAGGVKLGLADEAALWEAYRDLRARLGPRVLVSPMAGPGVEMALGVVVDPQFGPLVMVGAGGLLVEFVRDTRFALAPLDAAAALRLIDGLAVRPLLDGVRGQPAADLESLVDAVVRLSTLADALREVLAEIDVNPFIAGPDGGVAVDALVIPQRS